MHTRQWHPFLVPVVGLPLKLHSSQGLFFPKTAILMLRERFLIAKNTCEKFFPRYRFAPLSRLRAPPSAVRYDSGPYHFFYAAAAPGLHLLTKAEMNEILGIAFRYLFQFRNDLLQIMNSAKHRLALDKQKYVSVHIRTGFVGTNHLERTTSPKFIRKEDQWEKMLQCHRVLSMFPTEL